MKNRLREGIECTTVCSGGNAEERITLNRKLRPEQDESYCIQGIGKQKVYTWRNKADEWC